MKLVLVGESFGEKEDLFKFPFIGSSGRELARMLIQAKITPPFPYEHPSELEMVNYWKRVSKTCDLQLTNVFMQRPANNDIEQFFCPAKDGLTTMPPLKLGKYLRPHLFYELERLWTELAEWKPNLILAMGNVACWAVLGQTKISALRGSLLQSPQLGLKVLPTFHPSAVLRDWSKRPIVIKDLFKAKFELEFPEIRRKERWLTVNPTIADIREWMTRPADRYGVDIETSLKQISMISFARSPSDAICIPFHREDAPDLNYWPSVQEEVQAWRCVAELLSKPVPKVFQNGIYDLTYLLRSKMRPKMCICDSMLLHHSIYPELPKSLGFLGSIYGEGGAWKEMRGHALKSNKRDE